MRLKSCPVLSWLRVIPGLSCRVKSILWQRTGVVGAVGGVAGPVAVLWSSVHNTVRGAAVWCSAQQQVGSARDLAGS
jgi:hypothetical protein